MPLSVSLFSVQLYHRLLTAHLLLNRKWLTYSCWVLAAVPRYADIINILDVTILIKAPKRHYNVSTYKARARNISRLIKIINTYHVRRLEVIAFLNNHNSFGQLTLAAGAYNLRFQGWKLAYKIPGANRKWKIQIDSQWERQLCALYQAELLTLHQWVWRELWASVAFSGRGS